jgi:CRISPR/Cas system CMR-associated protein Cmr5 small subunit
MATVEIKEYDERKASNALFAVIDAKRQNEKYEDGFSALTHSFANEVKSAAQSGYFRSRVYKTSRKGFIAVKVDNVQAADKLSKEVEALNNFCTENDIDIVAIGKNIVYRIKERGTENAGN